VSNPAQVHADELRNDDYTAANPLTRQDDKYQETSK
jgi:hypothetical protein